MRRNTLLQDSFEFKSVPYVVRVQVQTLLVNGETDEIHKDTMNNRPDGFLERRKWARCDCLVARVRPDYPYTEREEWPAETSQHFYSVLPLEWPRKSYKQIIPSYNTVQVQDLSELSKKEIDYVAQELADEVVDKLKTAYHEAEKPIKMTA